jgi:hypothetical protein
MQTAKYDNLTGPRFQFELAKKEEKAPKNTMMMMM